ARRPHGGRKGLDAGAAHGRGGDGEKGAFPREIRPWAGKGKQKQGPSGFPPPAATSSRSRRCLGERSILSAPAGSREPDDRLVVSARPTLPRWAGVFSTVSRWSV